MIGAIVAVLISGALADTPASAKPSSSKIRWNEEKISAKIAKWSHTELLAAQTIFRSALDGHDFCGFSPEYLAAAPQFFQGELASREAKPDALICGKPALELTNEEARACAKQHAKKICAQLR